METSMDQIIHTSKKQTNKQNYQLFLQALNKKLVKVVKDTRPWNNQRTSWERQKDNAIINEI